MINIKLKFSIYNIKKEKQTQKNKNKIKKMEVRKEKKVISTGILPTNKVKNINFIDNW